MVRKILLGFILGLFLISGVLAALPPPVSWSVDITEPLAQDQSEEVSLLKWELNGDLDLDLSKCYYSVDGGATKNVTACSFGTNTINDVLSHEDDNSWIVYVEDENGTEQTSQVDFWVDSIYPEIYVTNLDYPNHYTNQTTFTIMARLIEANWNHATKPITFNVWDINNFQNINYPVINSATNISSFVYNTIYDGDGEYRYSLDSTDSIGHSNSTEGKIIIDTINPVVTINSPLNDSYPAQQTQIDFSVVDANVDYCEFNDGGGLVNADSCSSHVATSVEGSNTWTINAYDKAGNSDSSSVTFEVDTIPPVVNVVYPVEGQLYSSDVVEVNFTATDPHLESCWVDGEPAFACSAMNTYTITSVEGSNTWTVYANDSFGHVGTANVNFEVDTVAPTLTNTPVEYGLISFAVGNTLDIIMNSSELIVDWGTTRVYDSSGVQVKYFSGTCDNELSCVKTWDGTDANGTLVADGVYTVNTTIEDQATHVSTVYVGNLTIDNTPPVITVNGTDVQIEKGSEYVDDGATIDDGSVVVVDNSSLDLNEVGNYTITYDANDSSGNVAIQQTRNVEVVDTTAPVITIDSPTSSGTYYPTTKISLEATANEDVSSWEYSFDAGANRTAFNLTDEINKSIGTYTLTIYGTDSEGNEGNDTLTFNVVEEPSNTVSSSGGGGGGGTSFYNCTKWSEWSECVNGNQTRECLERKRTSKLRGGITLTMLKKGETQTCTMPQPDTAEMFDYEEEEVVEEPVVEEGFISRITGAAVGFAKSRTGIVVITVAGGLALALAVLSFRKRLR